MSLSGDGTERREKSPVPHLYKQSYIPPSANKEGRLLIINNFFLLSKEIVATKLKGINP